MRDRDALLLNTNSATSELAFETRFSSFCFLHLQSIIDKAAAGRVGSKRWERVPNTMAHRR